ncbi:BrnT family toxin [Melaminivora sp.]|uniref:BrnT family toxin n=1 Tax=Melaminivora sp. TaxID=1933032 RepID=UPI0028ADF29C|nr:BrnT family toxin [Melaminivora sp.]
MEIAGFDWDGGNWPKCAKHGVSREEIERMFLEGHARIAPDMKHTTPAESRHIAAGRVDGRALFVAFAFRGRRIRPISARYMHAKEASNYEAST